MYGHYFVVQDKLICNLLASIFFFFWVWKQSGKCRVKVTIVRYRLQTWMKVFLLWYQMKKNHVIKVRPIKWLEKKTC